MSTIKITWETEAGYAGGSRPLAFEVDTQDFEDLEPEEIDALLCEMVQDEFDNRVSWFVRRRDETIAAIHEAVNDDGDQDE